MNNECIFCAIGSSENTLEYNKHIIDTDNFFVVVAKGQLCDGYLLICSREHISNTTLLSPSKHIELKDLKNRIRQLVSHSFEHKPIMFEHGDASDINRGGSCINHSHIHVLPLQLLRYPDFLNKFLPDFFSDYDAFRYSYMNKAPYFYFELSNGEIVAFQKTGLPCQFGRRLVFREFGLKEHWDWRINPTEDKMLSAIDKYESALNNGRILE